MKKLIKAIFIDFAGVITKQGHFNHFIESAKDNTLSLNELQELYNAAKVGKISESEYFDKVFVGSVLDESISKFELKKGILDFLQKNTLPIFIASNQVKRFEMFFLKKFGLVKYFNDIFISSEIRLKKATPEFYQFILDKTEYNPKEVLFIDDLKANLVYPKEIGMKTIWVNNNDSAQRNKIDFNADYTINSLTKLEKIIEELTKPLIK